MAAGNDQKYVDEGVVEEILALLPRLGRALARVTPADARREGLTLAQVKALIHLRQAGPQTMSELASALHISTPSATGIIDQLVERRLVVRRRDQKDRRLVTVGLARPAEPLVDRLIATRRHQIASVMEGLSPEEQRAFLERLSKLASAFAGS